MRRLPRVLQSAVNLFLFWHNFQWQLEFCIQGYSYFPRGWEGVWIKHQAIETFFVAVITSPVTLCVFDSDLRVYFLVVQDNFVETMADDGPPPVIPIAFQVYKRAILLYAHLHPFNSECSPGSSYVIDPEWQHK